MARIANVLALTAAATILAACKDEPTFDERFEAAEVKIRSTAAEMDEELATSEPRTGEHQSSEPTAKTETAAP